MPINVTCSTCNATLRAPDNAAGKQIKCPKCQAVIRVPEAEAPAIELTSSPPPPMPSAAPAPAAARRNDDDDRPSRRRDRDRDRDDDYDDRPRRRWRRDQEGGDSTSSGSNGISIGLGIGAIALGLIAAIFAFIPCCGAIVAWPAGGIGLLLGLIGVLVCVLAKQKSVAAMILTIAGSLVNVAAIAISVVWWIVYGAMAVQTTSEINKTANEFNKELARLEEESRKQKENFNKSLSPAFAHEITTTKNNFRQIGLAFHNMHDATKTFPAPQGVQGKKGRLSWRVAILPYIEQGALFTKFNLDEDWNSPHNMKVFNENPMPFAYKAVRFKAGEDRKTYIQLFTGQGTLYPDQNTKPKISQILDGTVNTLVMAEAMIPIEWTRPSDLEINPTFFQPTSSLGGVYGGDFHALAADGMAYYIHKNAFPRERILQLINPSDGMVVPGWPPK